MKTWLLLSALVLGSLIFFRSGRRWGNQGRGNTVAFFVLLLMLGGMAAMILLAVRLLY